jgi:hypothetical protein
LPTLAAEYVTDVHHARDKVDDGTAKEALGAEWRKIHLHTFGSAIGLDINRSDVEAGGEAWLPVGCIRRAPERDQERRAEADDQGHHQRRGLALGKSPKRGLPVAGDSHDQAGRAL